MAISDPEEQILRKFEREVLDKHHETLALWSRDPSTALYSVLACFDCWAILAIRVPNWTESVGATQIVKNLEEGLTESLRWLHNRQSSIEVVPTSDPSIIEEAGRFCKFAGQYVHVADFHKMYGRQLVGIEVDERARSVRFVVPADASPAASVLGMIEKSNRIHQLTLRGSRTNSIQLAAEVSALLRNTEYLYTNGHIALKDVTIANDERVKELIENGISNDPFTLSDQVDLAGFTVAEFEAFYGALRRWSYCCTLGFLFSIRDRGMQQWECAPTQCIQRAEFFESMRRLTGLSTTILESIVSRLAYDLRTQSPDVFQQPLFSSSNNIAWSAAVIQNSRQLRNQLKLMSRMQNLRNHASTLIGSREGSLLRMLSGMLSQRGNSECKLTTKVAFGGEEGEIDLLAYNKTCPNELLIIEGKAVLGVDEINEVDAATTEMQSGQKQIEKIKRILGGLSNHDKAVSFSFVNWSLVEHVYGVVVSADAEPNGRYNHDEHPGISLQTIIARFQDDHFESPQKFWRACMEREWMIRPEMYREGYHAIKVGNVTYELPVLAVP